MYVSACDSLVECRIHDALLLLPTDIQDAARVVVELSDESLGSETLPRRIIAAILLSGNDALDERGQSSSISFAAGFEIQRSVDRLRRNSWCGTDGTVRPPAPNTLGIDKARVLGNMLQSLLRSLVAGSSEQPEYLIHVTEQLEKGSLALSDGRYLLETLDTVPTPESILVALEKRAALFFFAALANRVCFVSNASGTASAAVERFGTSFGLAYQLWAQLKFVSEVRRGSYWSNEDLVVGDCIRTYPIAFALQTERDKYAGIISTDRSYHLLKDVEPTGGIEHTRTLLVDNLQASAMALEGVALPQALLNSWRGLIEQLALASELG